MPRNSETILTAQTHPDNSTTTAITGDQYKGDGYYSRADGFHTVQYSITDFVGTIKIQATLAITPTLEDWFDVSGTSLSSTATTDPTASGSFVYNFSGNYVWVRAIVSDWTAGTVKQILLNH
jgi:hypothetical protein